MTKQPAGNTGKQETVTPLGESSPSFEHSTGPLAENWTQDYTALPPSASVWKVYGKEAFVLYLHSAFWKLKQTNKQKNNNNKKTQKTPTPLQIV